MLLWFIFPLVHKDGRYYFCEVVMASFALPVVLARARCTSRYYWQVVSSTPGWYHLQLDRFRSPCQVLFFAAQSASSFLRLCFSNCHHAVRILSLLMVADATWLSLYLFQSLNVFRCNFIFFRCFASFSSFGFLSISHQAWFSSRSPILCMKNDTCSMKVLVALNP